MKRLKLNLDELSRELEVLEIDYLKGIKGGYGTPDGGDGDYGNYGGYGGPDNPIELDPVEIYGGYDDYDSGGGSIFPPGWVPPYDPGDDNYLPGMGGDDGGSGGYGGYGSLTLEDKYTKLLQATDLTVNSFHGTMDMAYDIAKISDFAEEAKNVLKSISRYSGGIGTALDISISLYEALQDGQITRDEFVTFVTDQVVGGTIGAIPFAGGFLATVYDMAGYDEIVEQKIRNLINKHW
ncbi:hypothetical protein [Albibacterium profundi]|uniref:Uncharacterized protein n=1 Tax=Albibacterium profundi TaxID=3134906 RepID=A0ABV5CDV9_9SPHI